MKKQLLILTAIALTTTFVWSINHFPAQAQDDDPPNTPSIIERIAALEQIAWDRIDGEQKGEGEYLNVKLEGVKKGDLIQVSLTGSAQDGAFYYEIIESSGTCKEVMKNEQPAVLSNQKNVTGSSWYPIGTQGLFMVEKTGDVVFKAKIYQGYWKGKDTRPILVRGLSIIARVVGR